MRKYYLFAVLMAVLLLPWARAAAQDDLTVSDGTYTSAYVPFYAYYADYSQRSQIVYPSDSLQDMAGSNISGLALYSESSASYLDNGTFEIRVAELDTPQTFDGYSSTFIAADFTTVYNGNLSLDADNKIAIEFNEPFNYNGGSLLVEVIYTATGSNYGQMYFLGTSISSDYLCCYSYTSATSGSGSGLRFLPKTTFSYVPAGNYCRKPGKPQLTEATTSSLEFHWDGYGLGGPYVVIVDDAVVEESWNDTTYSISGLAHSSSYTIGVRRICESDDGEDTSRVASATFNTQCAHIDEFPITFTFEDENIDCWTLSSDNSIWVYDGASFAYNGDKFLIMYKSSSDYGNEWAITPPIDVPADASSLTMSWAAAGNGSYLATYPVSYQVLISTTASTDIANGFDTVYADTLTVSNDYRLAEISMEQYAGQTITVAFRHTTATVYYGSNAFFFIDDLAFRSEGWPVARVGRYSQYGNTAMASVTVSEEATFEAWLVSGDDNGLSYTWSSTMASAGNATLTPDDANVTLVYSAAGTDTLTLVAQNSTGSDEVQVIVMVNEIELASLPFYSNFDSDDEINRWTVFSLDSTATSTWKRFTPPYAGSYGVGSWCLPDSAQTDVMIVSPAIAVPENVGNMSLMYQVAGFVYDTAGPDMATYDVLVSTNGRSTYQYFTDTIFRDSLNTNGYVPRSITLNGYAGQTIYVAIRHTSVGAQALLVDELEIREAATPVIGVEHENVAFTSEATTYRAYLTEGLAEGATYTWTSTKLDADEATVTDNGIDSILVLNYTAPGFDTVKVVVTNSFGADSAQFVVRVRDLGNVATMPYACDFETEAENAAWEVFSGTSSTNQWHFGTAAGTSTGLYVSSDNGTTHGYDIYSASISMAVRIVSFDVATEYAISYDWMANGESSYDFIRVFLAPATADLSGYTYGSISYGTLPTGFIALDGGDKLNLQSTWQTYSGTFEVPQVGNYQLVVCWRNDGSGGTAPSGAFDNLSISVLTCPRPHDLAITDITTNSATLSWTAGGVETQWKVVVDDEAPVLVTETSYPIENLASSSMHSVAVYAICDEEDISYSAIAQFRTLCDEVPLPWTEDFEAYQSSQFPDCWTWLAGYSYGSSRYPYITAYQHHNGTNATYDYLTSTYPVSMMATPVLDAEANALSGSFWVRGYESYYDNTTYNYVYQGVRVQLGVLTDVSDTSAFVVVLDTLVNTYNQSTGLSDWIEVQFTTASCGITDHSALAFRASLQSPESNSTAYVYLDDINVVSGDLEQYSVSVASADEAMGSVSSTHTGTVYAGTRVTVTATANTGYQFTNWTDADGNVVSTANPYTFTVASDMELTANFEQGQVGIDAASMAAVRLHPNPATSSVSVEFEGQAIVCVIDMNGRQVMVTESDSRATFDVTGLAKGAYFVRVTSAAGTAVSKLVVK